MQNPSSKFQQDDNNLNIIFKVRGRENNEDQFNIQIQADEKVSTLIQKYRNKSGDFVIQKKFIFNAKSLNPSLSCAEAGLSNNSIVQVIDTRDALGALI